MKTQGTTAEQALLIGTFNIKNMSKKTIIIISAALAIFLIALIGYYFIVQNNAGTDPSGKTTGFRSFFPFGGNNNSSNETSTENNTTEQQPTQTEQVDFTKKLRRLSTEPVSGAGVLDIKAGTVVRFIEKATGHIFETELFSPNTNRISNTTIPVVINAMWGNGNNSLIARYLKDDNQTVDTYSLTLKTVSTSTENTISGIAFPSKISDVSVFETSVFYLEQGNNFSTGFISKFDGGSKKQIWNSAIKELLSQYINAKTVALTTKSAPGVSGFLYFVDTGTGFVRSIISNVPGLSTLVNPDGTKVLYLEQGSGTKMFLFDQKTKISTDISPITFPEKCVWSKKDATVAYCAVPKEYIDNNTLTSWYQGLISTNDDIWKFDTKSNSSTVIESLSISSGFQIDVIKPILSTNERYLIFINKIDNSLWSLDLTK